MSQLREIETKLRYATGSEAFMLRNQLRDEERKLGLGDVLRQVAQEAGGSQVRSTHTVRADRAEHALVFVYDNFQIILHLLDDPSLYGEGSRFKCWWRRQVAPSELTEMLDGTKRWLEKRSASRSKSSLTRAGRTYPRAG